jgi:hypothetical protein
MRLYLNYRPFSDSWGAWLKNYDPFAGERQIFFHGAEPVFFHGAEPEKEPALKRPHP